MSKKPLLMVLYGLLVVIAGAFIFLWPTLGSTSEETLPEPVATPQEKEVTSPPIQTAAGSFKTIQEAVDAAQPGDTVTIPAGVYDESLRIYKTLRLEGAGSDKTIISVPHTKKSAITTRRSAEVVIAGLKVEHSDMHRAEEELEARPELVRVLDSKTVFENCIVGPSIAYGILVDEEGHCALKDTVVEKNHYYGLYIREKGSEMEARGLTLRENKEGGALVSKGGTFHVEDSTVVNNDKWGLRAINEDSILTVKNSKVLQNKGLGTQFEMQASGFVEGCEYRENQGNAIAFIYGATGTAKNNLCADNQGFGVNVQSISTKVDVLDNRCTGNKDSGVIMEYGARGTIVGNHCEGNNWDGILVANWLSSPVVTNNHCVNNKRYGILFSLGATGEADGNYCAGNGSHGLALLDELTEVKLGSNQGENNGGEDFVQLEGKPVSEQDQIITIQIIQALQKEQFDSLEIIAERLRDYKPVYAWGDVEEQSPAFYNALVQGMGPIGPHRPEIFTPIFERWKEAYPDSVTPYVALAELHLHYGWIARGTGYSHTVTPEGWETLKRELTIAQEYLLQAEKINPQELRVYVLGMKINRGLWNDSVLAKEWYDKGLEIDPCSYSLNFDRAFGLLRRWGGKTGEMAKFMREVYERSREKHGAWLYTSICVDMATCIGDIYLAGELGIDWDILERGCKEMLEAKPEWTFVLHQYCVLACMYHKQELAKALFDQIGDNNDQRTWKAMGDWETWKAWANGEGEAPRGLRREADKEVSILEFISNVIFDVLT